jgi:hypothetical protein
MHVDGSARFFDVFGKNALFVFALSAFIPKTLWLIRIPDGVNKAGQQIFTDPWRAYYKYVCAKYQAIRELGLLLLLFLLSFFCGLFVIGWTKRRFYVKV